MYWMAKKIYFLMSVKPDRLLGDIKIHVANVFRHPVQAIYLNVNSYNHIIVIIVLPKSASYP